MYDEINDASTCTDYDVHHIPVIKTRNSFRLVHAFWPNVNILCCKVNGLIFKKPFKDHVLSQSYIPRYSYDRLLTSSNKNRLNFADCDHGLAH